MSTHNDNIETLLEHAGNDATSLKRLVDAFVEYLGSRDFKQFIEERGEEFGVTWRNGQVVPYDPDEPEEEEEGEYDPFIDFANGEPFEE